MCPEGSHLGMKQTTTNIGSLAEQRVAEAFRRNNFQIIDQNWRQKSCEIDLVVSRDAIVYFVEVRYRSSLACGQGYDTINSKKLQKMYYGARVWVAYHGWYGEFKVLVASVSDERITIINAA